MKNERVLQLLDEIKEKYQELAKIRKEEAPEEIKDYTFTYVDGSTIQLYDIIHEGEELLLIHNMGKSCVYCTMWADVLSGMYTVINDRVPIILTSPDDPETVLEFSSERNWQMPCYSYNGSDFSKDLGFAHDKEGRRWYMPGVSALFKKDGKVYRSSWDYFGPGDAYCAPWHLFELLKNGVNGWEPKYNYE